MAKTIYPSTYYGLVFGYGVNTTVVGASHIPGGSHYEGDPPVLVQDPPIGVKVYPASIAGIEFSSVLEIGGYGQILVSGVASDEGGSYFTYGSDSEPLPATGTYIRSPWSWVGADLYARTSGNSITLHYSETVEHDLYVETVVATTCGQIHVYLDGNDFGLFNCYDPDPNGHPHSFLIASNVTPGWHTIQIVAEGISPSGNYNFVYFRSFSLFEHVPETGGEYLYNGPDGSLEQSTNNFVGTWAVVGGAVPQAYTITQEDAVIFYPQLDAGGKITFRTISGIFELYLKHCALLPVLQELERRGWHMKGWTTQDGISRGGRPFTKGTLHRLLTNAVFTGKIEYQEAIYAGEHEAIIDRAVWDQVQKTLRRNGRSNGISARNKYGALLRGLLFCVPCGTAMPHSYTARHSKRYRYYVCYRAQQKGWKHCETKSISAPAIETAVLESIRNL